MAILRGITRNDLFNRFANHTFTETTVNDLKKVEFKDGGGVVIAKASKLSLAVAYEAIRKRMVGEQTILHLSTTAQRNNLIGTPLDGQQIYNTTANAVQTYDNGAWI